MIASNSPVIIIGAGLAGLTAGAYLKRQGISIRILEAGDSISGLCRSDKDEEGFTYDCGAHFITNRLAAALGISTQCRPMPRYGESVFYDGRVYSHPFGLLKTPRFVGSALWSKTTGLFHSKPVSAQDFYRSQYGRRLADEVALPLTEAWSGVPTDQLSAAVGDKLGTSLPWMICLRLAGWITGRTVGIGYSGTVTESPHAWHVYPEGGISAVCEKLCDEVADDVALQSRVEAIEVDQDRVTGVVVNGIPISARAVVSTAPVHILGKLIRGSDKLDYLKEFRYRAMIFVNLKIVGDSGLPDVVTWTPTANFPFFRVSDIGMGLPWLVPEGKSQLTCDIGCEVGDSRWTTPDDELAELCAEHLQKMVPGIKERVIGSRVVRVTLAYPVYHLKYEQERRKFNEGTGIEGLVSIGRNGEFAHILMEDVFWRTRWKLSGLVDSLSSKPAAGEHVKYVSE